MRVAQIQFASWDKKYNFNPSDLDLNKGDFVLVETEFGQEIGELVSFKELSDDDLSRINDEIKPIVRLAKKEELELLASEEEKESALDYCRGLVKKHSLPMKMIDVNFSLDRNRINFAFYSDSRVDFRELVKELGFHFKGVIRLTQVGSRDEARINGDFGHCGRGLCCKGHLKEFCQISSSMAEDQQVSHRGSDRVSGVCGKLMCCLSYEHDAYLELAKNLPDVGTRVNVDGRRGEVVGRHILKQSVDVLFRGEKEGENNVVVEVDINRNKKK